MSVHSRISALLFVLFVFFAAYSKAATIKGRVLDALNGEPLPGASLLVIEMNKGVAAASDGSFRIPGLKPGEYQIQISFIGYETTLLKVIIVEKDEVIERTVELSNTGTELEEVEIRARAQGITLALSRQEAAPNIMNIVEAEQIQSFPDLNAADALARVSGISVQRDQGEGKYIQIRGTPANFTNFNVNGVQLPSPETGMRTVGMDIINSSQIQTLEVSKVLTPDMNADAIGGNVNLVTKRATTTQPEINALAAIGYNNLRDTDNGELQFSYGNREGRIGFLVNGNYMYTNQGADNIEFNYEKGVFFGDTGVDNYHIQYDNVQLRHYELTRQRTGLSTTIDYNFDEHSLIYVSGMFNRYIDDETRRRKVYNLDDATSEKSYLYGGIQHDVRHRTQIQNLSVISIGMEHKFNWANIDYEFAWTRATEEQPDRLEAEFSNVGEAIFIRFDRSDPEYPKATFPNPDNALSATDYENFEFDKLILEEHLSEDINLNYKLNVQIPYKKGKNEGFVKFGSIIRTKDKTRNIVSQSYAAYFEQSRIYPLPGPPLTLTRVTDDFRDDNLLNQGYVMEAMPNADKMREFFEEYGNLFVFGDEGITETRELTFGEDYVATEDVYAYYAMAQQHIGKLMVLGGLRYEQTDITYQGNTITKISSGYFDSLYSNYDSRTQAFWLPNIQFKYTLNKGTNIRAALTYSYARPNFDEVIPYRETVENDEISYGNPNLKYPEATNIDILAEKYWNGLNMVSGGVFYKKIDNFIFNNQFFGYEGDPRESNFDRYLIKVPLNGIEANVRGFEIQSQQMLRFLPGFTKNFGVFLNYTYTDSDALMQQRKSANDFTGDIIFGGDYDVFFESDGTERITLPGQAKHSLNMAFFYDTPKLYLKISANYNDEFLYSLGVDEDLDEYYGEAWRVDFNGYYQFTNAFQLFADVRNITNEPLRYYLGKSENGRVRQKEFYSYWARMGIRMKF